MACEQTPEGYTVKARDHEGRERTAEGHDQPPEAFVEKVSDEGGDVYVAPLVEALREATRRRRAAIAASDGQAASTADTVPRMSENR